jgi:cellobiose phosphorylase
VAALVAVEEDSAAAEAADSEEASTMDLEKCIKQLALSVRRNVKFRSNQQKVSQFIAKSVTSREKILKTEQHLDHQDVNNRKTILVAKTFSLR